MKKYFITYKPFLLFLTKFFLIYLLLTLVYQSYLNSFDSTKVDSITIQVAKNTKQLLAVFNQDFNYEFVKSHSYMLLFYKQKSIARIIEGCNAVNIIILFIAFLISFTGKLKTTLFFILFGSISIYILNIFRIAILCVLLYYYPEQEGLLHRIFFPLIIYGFVFVLWIIWITKFSFYAKINTNT